MILRKILYQLEAISNELRIMNALKHSSSTSGDTGRKEKITIPLSYLLRGTNVTLGELRKALLEDGWDFNAVLSIKRDVLVYREDVVPVIKRIQTEKINQIKS